MPTIPDAANIPRRQFSGAAPVVRTDSRSALGSAVTFIGAKLDESQKRQSAYEVSKANSDFLIGKAKLDSSFDKDEDYGTFSERYQKGASELLSSTGEGITDPAARALFAESQGVRIAVGDERIKGMAWDKERDFKRAEVNEGLNELREVVIGGGGIDANEAAKALIDSAAGSDYYGEEEAGKIYKVWKDDSAVAWLNSIPPEQRLESLKSPMADNLPSDVRASMTRKAEIAAMTQKSVDMVDDWMDQDLSRNEMIAKTAEIPDEKLRKAVEGRADYAINADNKARLEDQSALFDEYFGKVALGELTVDEMPREDFDDMTPSMQGNLINAQRNSVRRSAQKSDRDVIDKLNVLYTGKDYSEARKYFTENSSRLSTSDFDTWSKMTVEGDMPEEYKTLVVNQQLLRSKLADVGVVGTSGKAEGDAMLEDLRDWHLRTHKETGKIPDDKAVNDKIDQLLIETSRAPGWLFGTSTKRLHELSDEDIGTTVRQMREDNPELADEMLKIVGEDGDPLDFIEAYERATNR